MNHHALHTVAAGRRLVRLAGGLAVVGAAWAALAGGCTRSDAGTGKASTALTADRAKVKKASFDITTTASGELEAKNQIEIRSQLEAQSTIVKIVDEGVSVKKGDVLIELNCDKIDSSLLDAQIALEGAKADLTTAENNLKIQETDNSTKSRQAELKVELAKITLEQWEQGEVKKKRQDLALAIEKADRDVKRLREKFDRSKDLLERGFLSKNDFQLDEIAKIESEAAVAKSALENTIYEEFTYKKERKKNLSDVEDAQAELERTKLNAQSELANKQAALNKAQEQLKRRDEQLAKLQKQKAACTIIAPSDGLVVYGTSLERNRWGMGGDGALQVGREVYPNMLLMVLPDTSEMVASVKVQESLAGRVKPGQIASVRVDAAGGRAYTGRVESIGVLAESGGWRDPNLREYTVKISLQDVGDASGLKPSMRCESQLVLGKVDDAASVPVQAVFNDGAVRFVYASQGSQFVRVPVKLGRRSDTTAEIAAGLSEDQIVLLREPSPGEVLGRTWDKDELKAAGYAVGEDGLPYAAEGESKRGPGGKGADSPKGRAKAEPAAKTDAVASVAGKPSEPPAEAPKGDAPGTTAVKTEAAKPETTKPADPAAAKPAAPAPAEKTAAAGGTK